MSAVIIVTMILILSLLMLVQSDEINNLRDVNPTVRKNSLSTLAAKDIKGGIRPIIDLLAREPDDSVRNAADVALEQLTGLKGNGPDFARWHKWWEEDGKKKFGSSSYSEAGIQQRV